MASSVGGQALLVAYLRKAETYTDLACGFAIGTTTVYLWVPRTLSRHATAGARV
jgi:hypothetical protein